VKTVKFIGLAAAVLALATSVGCKTRLDRHWGESQRAVVAAQTVNPEPEVAQPTMDGATAEKAVESHRKIRPVNAVEPGLTMSPEGGY
jgi:hypothetical protein